MGKKIHLTNMVLLGGFFLLLDQYLKHLARTNPDHAYYLWKNWLGWEYFTNPGIAFSLPFPNILLIIITPLIIIGLFHFLSKVKNKNSSFYLGILLIVAGAISNLIDRVIFSTTIDYLRIFTSIINTADVMIVLGAIILVLNSSKKETEEKQLFPDQP
ncbi:MAG: hypothetical protein COX81_03265 [Candidatus Magasanikbacteria bacterium CG_4_10_14_0_2_um_filter_37_12]|uniref:Lipoprotein signal peptidase n=1 Tax=Candidatus Magasanikbacteria bacterium CG_4_10_14_0_2_um_filter_37_12 TaxID=1974637 RepID=A0A2M7V7A2_9BACT|nr:MAG: hypothetical protein COX81_03265 [Candidatus Magasanikbacteria bacterium CG_4_10_14_0_2_um_filter_37_12]